MSMPLPEIVHTFNGFALVLHFPGLTLYWVGPVLGVDSLRLEDDDWSTCKAKAKTTNQQQIALMWATDIIRRRDPNAKCG